MLILRMFISLEVFLNVTSPLPLNVSLTRPQQRPTTWQPWQEPKTSITRTWRRWVSNVDKESVFFSDRTIPLNTHKISPCILFSSIPLLSLRFVGETFPMWLLPLWRRSTTSSSRSPSMSSPPQRRWEGRSSATATETSLRPSW